MQLTTSNAVKNTIITILISACLCGCAVIHNKHALLDLNQIGDSTTLRKNGYFYRELSVRTNPYFRNEYGGFERDSTITFNQVRIAVLALDPDGSAIRFGSYSGMRDNLSFDFGIKCDLQDNNTLESALRHFECHILQRDEQNIHFMNSKAEIWNQGVYKIDKDSIRIQTYYNTRGNYQLYEESGYIENDSTIVLTKSRDYAENQTEAIHKVFRFKQMDNFPQIDNYILKNRKKFRR